MKNMKLNREDALKLAEAVKTPELLEELEELKNHDSELLDRPESKYLKAVKATLMALDFDEDSMDELELALCDVYMPYLS